MKKQVQIAAAALVVLTGAGTGAWAGEISPDDHTAEVGKFAADRTLALREAFDRRVATVRIEDRRDRVRAKVYLMAEAADERADNLTD